MKTRTIMVLLLALAVLAACGGKPVATAVPSGVQQSTPAAQATARPTTAAAQPTAVPTAAAAQPTSAAEEYELGDSSSLDKLDSYRATYGWKWSETKDGAPTTGYWEALDEYSRADDARHSIWSSSEDSMEIIRIGQYTYYKGDDNQWISMLTTEDDPTAASAMFSDPLGIISGNKGKLVQRGMSVNGVTADHYRLAESSGGFLTLGAAEKMSGDVYVSPDLQVVVKYVAHYEGKSLGISGGTNGVVDVTFDLTDINKRVKIVAPEGVAPPVVEDIPVMDGATDLTAMSGVVSYKTTHSVAEVTAFYLQAMPSKGWKADQTLEGMLTFAKDQRQATIMIQAEGSNTTVTAIATQ